MCSLHLGVQIDRIRYRYGCYHIRIRFRNADTDIKQIRKLHIHILKNGYGYGMDKRGSDTDKVRYKNRYDDIHIT